MKFSDPSKLLVNMTSEFQQFDLEKLSCIHKNDSHNKPVLGANYTGGNDQFIWSAGNYFLITFRWNKYFEYLELSRYDAK